MALVGLIASAFSNCASGKGNQGGARGQPGGKWKGCSTCPLLVASSTCSTCQQLPHLQWPAMPWPPPHLPTAPAPAPCLLLSLGSGFQAIATYQPNYLLYPHPPPALLNTCVLAPSQPSLTPPFFQTPSNLGHPTLPPLNSTLHIFMVLIINIVELSQHP